MRRCKYPHIRVSQPTNSSLATAIPYTFNKQSWDNNGLQNILIAPISYTFQKGFLHQWAGIHMISAHVYKCIFRISYLSLHYRAPALRNNKTTRHRIRCINNPTADTIYVSWHLTLKICICICTSGCKKSIYLDISVSPSAGASSGCCPVAASSGDFRVVKVVSHAF